VTQKDVLQKYLQRARDAIVWKAEGLSERDLRMPRTATGTNLLGLVKHCIAVEAGYLGHTFGRPFPDFETVMPWLRSWVDPSVPEVAEEDMWATADEPADEMIALYRRVWAHGDATVAQLDLDTVGRVPWWNPPSDEVSLHTVLVHVISELQRHAGHADIVRESIDGAAGLMPTNSNLWTDVEDRAAYVARLRALAETFPQRP
jgi:uncharacterized damage-inducible protein DinB